MIKLCLFGYGKMGKIIDGLSSKEGFTTHYIVARKEDFLVEKLLECDVAIDFSTPESAFENIVHCIKSKIPIVSGTTGWLDKIDEAKKLLGESPHSAFLYGSNFSIGANLFFMVNKYLGTLMKDQPYNLSLTEIHHTTKLDSPSGTAISIANDLLALNSNKLKWVNQETTNTDEIGIISKREHDVKGTHVVTYDNEVDSISIEHKAKSREGFALGALKAAAWLKDKQGYFTVQDFIAETLKQENKNI